MYDRRIDGKEYVFGNQGALYMNAMTWWDHETGSVWSQVTGQALSGPLRGTALRQIAAPIETWADWQQAHPGTEVMRIPSGFFGEPPDPRFVIGVRIGDDAAAFAFPFVADHGVVNDEVGGTPIVVYGRDDLEVRVYAREVGGTVITFQLEGGRLVDPSTGTAWDAATGVGVSGPLAGETLHEIAWSSAFDWAWRDFYPDSRFIGSV